MTVNYVCFLVFSVPVPHIPSWEFPRSDLAIERVIGNGAFGVVSKAYARHLPGKPEWTTVAVKSLQGNIDELIYMSLLRLSNFQCANNKM